MDEALPDLIKRVEDGTGFRIRGADVDRFREIAQMRARFHGEETIAAYLKYVSNIPPAHGEWSVLSSLLTPGESYFFRDRGQVELLEHELLPELMRRAEKEDRKRLRLWSAGCSTGEEAYTLAMITDRVIPDRGDWKIEIIGTDVNDDSLEVAHSGLYTRWSFRQVPESLQRAFFHAKGKDQFQIDERIQEMVRFDHLNLVRDAFPVDFDLILCRNVFIYLTREHVTQIMDGITNSLRPGGYFVTGHGELTDVQHSLHTLVFARSIVFERSAGEAQAPPPRRFATPGEIQKRRPPTPQTKIPVYPAEQSPPAKIQPSDLPEPRRTKTESESIDAAGMLRDARSAANSGRSAEAQTLCQKILEVNPFDVPAFFLLAQVAEERGDDLDAIDLLKRTIYLDPDYAPGYMELALLYSRVNDGVRAARMRRTALSLLKALPPEAEVEEYEGRTARELLEEAGETW